MRRSPLPITYLPAWSALNDVVFYDTSVGGINDKGNGLTASKALSSENTMDTPSLLRIPRDLILCKDFIEEHSKVDQHFRELLDVSGGESLRGDIMLFLLMQITISSPNCPAGVGVSNPWTEYVRLLPEDVPLPTMWGEEEQTYLLGTSLELPLRAKMAALLREFERLRDQTCDLPWCEKAWWESESLRLDDWIMLDSWFRSRSLELPVAGESMVPCVDMANHYSEANSYYEQLNNGDVVLLLRPDIKLTAGGEVNISYGSNKSSAEMLFSYGFVDAGSATDKVVLSMSPIRDDPLGKAKFNVFGGSPTVTITGKDDSVECTSPFAYFMSLNEEDGLDFRVLQETDGSRSHLRVFWQDVDVTDSTEAFEDHLAEHPLKDLFMLRVVSLLEDRIQDQLERLWGCDEEIESRVMDKQMNGKSLAEFVLEIRQREGRLLKNAFISLASEKSRLLESPTVIEYLGSADGDDVPQQEDRNSGDDDYS